MRLCVTASASASSLARRFGMLSRDSPHKSETWSHTHPQTRSRLSCVTCAWEEVCVLWFAVSMCPMCAQLSVYRYSENLPSFHRFRPRKLEAPVHAVDIGLGRPAAPAPLLGIERWLRVRTREVRCGGYAYVVTVLHRNCCYCCEQFGPQHCCQQLLTVPLNCCWQLSLREGSIYLERELTTPSTPRAHHRSTPPDRPTASSNFTHEAR